ncbi:MAG: tetratricopeptide repeat protein, partial [Pseudomonadota bacterium]|nr:tetratricopeptide repeat protein [Pseudomonadota bacterium]
QPYRYAVYLRQRGRGPEAAAVVTRLSENGPRSELPWALIGLTLDAGDPSRAIAHLQKAISLDPNLTLAWIRLAYFQDVLGLSEAELASRRHALRTVRRHDRGGVTEMAAAVIRPAEAGRIATLLGDHQTAVRFQTEVEAAPKSYGYGPTGSAVRAELLALNHDVSGARRALPGRLDDGELVASLIEYDVNLPNYYAAVALDDWPAALAQLRAAERAAAEHGAPHHRNTATLTLTPLIAEALARTGRLEEAEATAARTRLDCYPCLRVRGEIATLRRDWPAAERWFAEAARQGPSLPFAFSEWGEARLARGDAAGAIRLFREAQERGPRWADPLKLEGDNLARQGRSRQAVRRYREATERAPRWGAAHLAWGRSLEALGREEQARAKYAQAARLDLSAADRAAVTRLLARPT